MLVDYGVTLQNSLGLGKDCGLHTPVSGSGSQVVPDLQSLGAVSRRRGHESSSSSGDVR
jgi:hypothetical protein